MALDYWTPSGLSSQRSTRSARARLVRFPKSLLWTPVIQHPHRNTLGQLYPFEFAILGGLFNRTRLESTFSITKYDLLQSVGLSGVHLAKVDNALDRLQTRLFVGESYSPVAPIQWIETDGSKLRIKINRWWLNQDFRKLPLPLRSTIPLHWL